MIYLKGSHVNYNGKKDQQHISEDFALTLT